MLAAICGPGFLLAPSTHSFSTDEATTEEVYLFSYLLPAVMELAGGSRAGPVGVRPFGALLQSVWRVRLLTLGVQYGGPGWRAPTR